MEKKPRHTVVAGQVWEDCDRRSPGRQLRVEVVMEPHVLATVVKTGKKVQIRLDRMYEHSTGYKLVGSNPEAGYVLRTETVAFQPVAEPFED